MVAGTGEAVAAIQDVAERAAQTESGLEQVRGQAERLTGTSADLKRAVSAFRL